MLKVDTIRDLSTERLTDLAQKHATYTSILKELGYGHSPQRFYFRELRKKLEKENIEFTSSRSKGLNSFKKLKDILVEDSSFSRWHLRKRLIEENLIDYVCNKCGIGDEWQGDLLSLQLEHINGINTDNRLENLTFLCPNCHSQTATFSGKKNKKESNKCIDCGTNIHRKSKRCVSCNVGSVEFKNNNHVIKRKVEIRPSKEQLLSEIKSLGFTGTGRKYGVRDNSIRKWCKAYGLPTKKKEIMAL